MKRIKPLLLVLALAAGLVTLVVGLSGQYARLMAEHWRKQLLTASDQQAPLLVGRVATLGQPGTPVLVEALGSRHESVARAAKWTLLEQLSRWEALSGRARSPKLATLADALARYVGQFGPTARRDAADLAVRILRVPLDPKTVDPGRLIGSCEKVLRATAPTEGMVAGKSRPSRHKLAMMNGRQSSSASGPWGPARALPTDSPPDTGVPPTGLPRLSGGGLPIETLAGPGSLADRLDRAQMADARAREPRRLAVPPAAGSPRRLERPPQALNRPDDTRAMPAGPAPSGNDDLPQPLLVPPLTSSDSRSP